jgi:hypothetical protein
MCDDGKQKFRIVYVLCVILELFAGFHEKTINEVHIVKTRLYCITEAIDFPLRQVLILIYENPSFSKAHGW